MASNWDAHWQTCLHELKEAQLHRILFPIQERVGGKIRLNDEWLWDFASNDYLGLSFHKEIRNRICQRIIQHPDITLGSSASRLLSGNRKYFEAVELKLAQFRRKPGCLIFSSGYQANIGVISSLYDRDTIIIADRLVHASIIDGIKLSGARFFRYRHNDVSHLENLLATSRNRYGDKRIVVITESLFSMEGDFAPLEEIAKLCRQYDALFYVDEAHSVGVWDIDTSPADVLIGTLGKAFGLWGAYVCGDKSLIEYLINRCRGFIFSTAPSPILFLAVEELLSYWQDEALLAIIDGYRERIEFFHSQLQKMGLQIRGRSQIVPVILGSSQLALEAAAKLRQSGFFAPAIRYPTVPTNEARLRLSVTALHNIDVLERLSRLLCALKEDFGL